MKIGKFLLLTRFICESGMWQKVAPGGSYGYSLGSRDALDGRNRNTRRYIMKNVYEFISGADLYDTEMAYEARHNCKDAFATAERLATSFVEGLAFAKVIEVKKGEDYIFTVVRVNNRILRDLVVIR